MKIKCKEVYDINELGLFFSN